MKDTLSVRAAADEEENPLLQTVGREKHTVAQVDAQKEILEDGSVLLPMGPVQCGNSRTKR